MEAAIVFAIVGDVARSESLAQDLAKRYPLGTQMQSLWLPAIQARIALGRKESGCRHHCPAIGFRYRVRSHSVLQQHFVPLSGLCARRGIPGRWTRRSSRCRVSEDSRPQWPGLELLDGSVGASGSGARQRVRKREPRRARMPMPPASGRSLLTKNFWRSGKMRTPTFPS